VSAEIRVAVQPAYTVYVGGGSLSRVGELVGERGLAVLTDGHVAALHGARLAALGDRPWIQVPRGEQAKTMAQLELVLEELAAALLDRQSLLVTLGGGSISDLGGLAASLYLRGIDVVHCPTTLLAQVDAAVGGKTGVNLAGAKNLAGSFHQPLAVVMDTRVLATLPEDELCSGLGEVLKSALLDGAGGGTGGGGPEGSGAEPLLELLERRAEALRARDEEALEAVVERCVRLKAAVVAGDEREKGPRKQLNLGHSFAHAIEAASGFALPHGVAVGVGLALALEASRRLGLLEEPELLPRTLGLLARLGLPSSLAELRRRAGPLAPADLEAALRHDKKGAAGEPRFVLPRRRGFVALDAALEPDLLRSLLA
jgi:3-dehydroquinate synthetase